MILTLLLLWIVALTQQGPQTQPAPIDPNIYGIISGSAVDPNSFGLIEGTVIDPQGKPVAGALVYSVGNEEGKRPLGGRWPPGPSTWTDSEGKFILNGVVGGVATIKASQHSEVPRPAK
jgi:protocatechuate 3,4-dioxygenase beta subunit